MHVLLSFSSVVKINEAGDAMVLSSDAIAGDGASYHMFKGITSVLPAAIVNIPGTRTNACAAKFISLSSRDLDIYWDDGKDGVPQGKLISGDISSTNSYETHKFYFTERNRKSNVIARVTIEEGKVSNMFCLPVNA